MEAFLILVVIVKDTLPESLCIVNGRRTDPGDI